MNLFENLITYYENDELDTLLEMSHLSAKRADKNRCGEFDTFIYFSQCLDSHGPRIKFYGGSKETQTTRTAPTYTFDKDGPGEVILQSWMNKKSCPNAFDKKCLEQISNFIKKTLPILLLVWFYKLNEDDALAYFQGYDSFEDLLNNINEPDKETKQELFKSKDLNDLHDKCKRYSVYNF